jgi:hypothetical protein
MGGAIVSGSFQGFDQKYIFDAAIIITMVPLGPLEVLSFPFWGTYFSLKELVKHRDNYEIWKSSEKYRLIHEN